MAVLTDVAIAPLDLCWDTLRSWLLSSSAHRATGAFIWYNEMLQTHHPAKRWSSACRLVLGPGIAILSPPYARGVVTTVVRQMKDEPEKLRMIRFRDDSVLRLHAAAGMEFR